MCRLHKLGGVNFEAFDKKWKTLQKLPDTTKSSPRVKSLVQNMDQGVLEQGLSWIKWTSWGSSPPENEPREVHLIQLTRMNCCIALKGCGPGCDDEDRSVADDRILMGVCKWAAACAGSTDADIPKNNEGLIAI